MKSQDVPQDNISTYASHKKAIYATDDDGRYDIVASTGWSVEEEATKQALLELERQTQDALLRAIDGEVSALYYHMYSKRMDLQVLAESTGFFKWTIRRDFEPKRFQNIKKSRLAQYADALGLSSSELMKLPKDRSE